MKVTAKFFAFCIALFCSPLAAQDITIDNPSVRIMGPQAAELAGLIADHRLVSEDIRVIGPDEEGDFKTLFVLLRGWSSVSKLPALQEICEDLCTPEEGKPLHLVSTTKVEGDKIRKSVFLDVNAVAPGGDISASLGFSGCVAEQLKIEARSVKAGHSPCIVRLVGGSFTDRRRIARTK